MSCKVYKIIHQTIVSSISGITECLLLLITVLCFSSWLICWLLDSRYNVVNSQKHAGSFDWSLKCLLFNTYWVPNICFRHVCNFTCVSIDSPILSRTISCCMLCSQLCQYTDYIGTAILCECSWNNFECTGKGFVWPLRNSFNLIGFFHHSACKLHFKSSATWHKFWVQDNISIILWA